MCSMLGVYPEHHGGYTSLPTMVPGHPGGYTSLPTMLPVCTLGVYPPSYLHMTVRAASPAHIEVPGEKLPGSERQKSMGESLLASLKS